MRELFRPELPLAARASLRNEKKIVDSGASARDEWDRFRGLAQAQPVIDALRKMTGVGERCAYCSDSLGADVDHFAPISEREELTFAWANLYWICTNCNRRKSRRFRTNPVTGEPLVLRPDVDRPWDFLYLDEYSLL
ncbi:HNH endonuclease [Microbacterium schleiferi]|uniref:HNH endonuclease n=1 Tax=Microbacterium schleiferi TaxID=69362 RepID=UPI0033889BD1